MQQKNRRQRIILADRIGFCFGVKRAVEMAETAIKIKKGKIFSIGPIIHSPQVVEKLTKCGLKVCKDLGGVKKKDTIIIRSHGLLPNLVKKAKDCGINLIDATCPFVKKAQKLAGQLSKKGYLVVIVGDKKHPEVKALVGFTDSKAVVLEDEKQAARFKFSQKKIGVIAQTTQSQVNFAKVITKLIQKNIAQIGANPSEVRIFDTICKDTLRRQSSAKKTAKISDVILVLGGRMSANSKRLAQTCCEIQPKAYHIEQAKDIKSEWLKGANTIGVASGASTPDWIISEVVKSLKRR